MQHDIIKDLKTFDFSVGPKDIQTAGEGHIFSDPSQSYGSETATTPRQRDAGARLHMLR
jgi:hypothetical protein